MNMYRIILFVAFFIACTQGSPLKVESSDILLQSNSISPEIRNATPNENLNAAILTIEEKNQKEANSSAEKSRRRVTPIMFMNPRVAEETYCNSIDDFPSFLTPEQRKYGAVIIPVLVGIYCFTLLAIICDNYFLPCVERICETLHLSKDVAAATFMAMATSAPELFVNIIGTFITESDMGIGTVVGSSMFNTLGVAALGSLAASNPIKVDWFPVTRDCTLYIIAISMLVIMTWDGVIFWYEGMTLFIVYFIYFTIMFNNDRISKAVKKLIGNRLSKPNASKEELATSEKTEKIEIFCIEQSPKSYAEFQDIEKAKMEEKAFESRDCEKAKMEEKVEEPHKQAFESKDCENAEHTKEGEETKVSAAKMFCTMPEGPWHKKLFFIYKWPIKLLLFIVLPDPQVKRRLFPITFILCIVFIGVNSYVISWMITIIGHTFEISESVLGLTFLAAGACLPEAVSIIIMSRKGEGAMGVSNALGANTMNILMSLGLPWFIKTMLIDGSSAGSFIEIASGSIEYTILGLILASIALFLTLFYNKFYLRRRTGVILTLVYLVFLSLAIMSEIMFIESSAC